MNDLFKLLLNICITILNKMKKYFNIAVILSAALIFTGCSTNREVLSETEILEFTPEKVQTAFEMEFEKGKKHNHPSFAIWIEDLEGNYIETLYVTKYVATGIFRYSDSEPGKWKNEPGFVRRPATLPYWAHKRNIIAPDGLYIPSPETPVSDAITGATPKGNFKMNTGTSVSSTNKFRVLVEINQAWDSNKFWTNNKYPEEINYFASLQPALVYAVTVDLKSSKRDFMLNPIGHSHYSGKTGELFTDISTLTTAKEIFNSISIKIK